MSIQAGQNTAPSPPGDHRPPAGTGSPAPRRTWRALRPLLVRLHFYAGIFIAPFLLVAALTGLAYTLTPQLDDLVYDDKLHVAQVGDDVHPLSEQVAAARAAHPEGSLTSVVTPPDPEDTTRVVLDVPGLGDNQRTVFVDPYTGDVQGALTTWSGSTPLTTWLDDLHRNLHLGDTGRLYSEVAASWLWVVVAGGLALWIGRSRGQRARSTRGVLLPERKARGVRRTRSFHAATGLWLALGLFFLSATGLTWSQHAGERIGSAIDAAGGPAPVLDTRLPDAAPEQDESGHGEHAGHHGGATADDDAATDASAFDTALRVAREAGLGGTVRLTPPADASTAWIVAQEDNVWPVHYDQVAVDPAERETTAHVRWADYPLTAKLSKLGIQGHMGVLFGLANQIVLAVIAIGLLTVIFLGYRMWWQRRPTRTRRSVSLGKAPERGTWQRLPLPALIIGIPAVVFIGWALPMLGLTLAAFLVADAALGMLRPQARAGLTPHKPGSTRGAVRDMSVTQARERCRRCWRRRGPRALPQLEMRGHVGR